MANCVLPEDIMLCILTRLPVKTILRFKSVCKPWLHLFSTPEFKKLHLDQFSSDPENQFFIIYSFGEHRSQPEIQYSIFNIESGKKRPTILEHPFAHTQNIVIETVGCCNGLVCVRSAQYIVLWNPAMKLAKTVPLKDCGPFEMASLGFGYDAMGADFKVVRVVGDSNFVNGKGMNVTSVEIYSVYLDSWITIDVGFQFSWFQAKNDLIVNGNPYWFARVDGKEVLVCFDVMELIFKIVPVPIVYWNGLDEEAGTEVDLVDLYGLDEETETSLVDTNGLDEEMEIETDIELIDWSGALGAILLVFGYKVVEKFVPTYIQVHSYYYTRVESLWVFDDIKQIWRKNNTFEPIEVDVVDRFLLCTKNEKVLGSLSIGTLFVLDLETGCVEELFDCACLGNSFEVYGYTESLAACISGMEKMVVKYERTNLDD